MDSLPPPLPREEQFPWPGLDTPALPHQGNAHAQTPHGHLGTAEFWNFDDLNPAIPASYQQHHQKDPDPYLYHHYSLAQMGLRAQRRYGISSAGLRQRWAL